MATILPVHQIAVVNLYTALFNRAPDAAGLTFWAQAFADGIPLAAITQSFMGTTEGRVTYPAAQTSGQFVASFYQTVFGRAADAGGLAFWTNVLDAAGGAGSDAARSSLVGQIVSVVTTPLSSQPAGISDADYARTTGDRALFANKVEIGRYFAVDLGGTNINLARNTLAQVSQNPASVSAAKTFADKEGVPDVPPTPTLAITAADTVADITAKFTAYPATIATVDASGMTGAQLAAVASAQAKIAADGITKLTLVLNDASIVGTVAANLLSKAKDASVVATGASADEITALVAAIAKVATGGISGELALDQTLVTSSMTTLLAKYAGTTAIVNATDMTVAQLLVIVGASAKVATGGITGTLALSKSLVAADITTLMTKYAGTAAVVDAAGMGIDQLTAVANASVKVAAGGISNLSLTLGDPLITDALSTALLPKASGVLVDATGASAAEQAALVSAIANVAVDGITGALPVGSGVTASQITALMAKYAGTTAIISASGMDAAQLAAVAGADLKVASIANPSLVLGDALITDTVTSAILAKATGATVNADGATATEVASLVGALGNVAAGGITGALAITKDVAASDITALMAKYAGSTATVNATGMSAEQLAVVGGVSGKLAAGGIANMALALGATEITDTVTQALLAKATAATVDASGATALEVAAMVTSIGNIAADGITGVLAVGSATGATDITALFAKYAGSTATVDASGMSTGQLVAVAGAAAKVSAGGIGNLSLALGNASITDAVSLALLPKASAALVDATGATADEIATVVASLGNVASNGLTGALPIDRSVQASDITALFAKYAGNTAVVTATTMSAAQLAAVAGGAAKVAANGITGMTLVLGDALITDAATTALLSKAVNVNIDATDASAGELLALTSAVGNIAAGGISGTLALNKTITDSGITALMAKYAGTTATVDATDMTAAQLAAVANVSSKLASGGIANLSLVLNDAAVTDALTAALLPKAVGARVDASGASTAELASLVSGLGNIAADGISGVLALNSGVTAANITALMAKYAGTTATVNAAGMDAAQLVAVADAGAKVASIATPALALGNALITDAVTSAILAKATAATVDAAGATATEVASLVGALGNVAANGITGALPVTSAVGASDTTALMSKYTGTTALANASSMSVSQQVAVANAGAKFATGGVTGLSLVLNDAAVIDSVTAALLTKASGASVDVTGATATEITALVSAIGNIAANGITGTLVLDSSVDAAGIAALMAKYAGNAATVNATGMVAAQQLAVSQAAGKLAAGGISNLSLALGDASITDAATTALLGKATNAIVDASGASANEVSTLLASLANVTGITGALPVSSAVSEANIPILFGKYTGTTATVNASGMSEAQLLAITGVNGKLAANGITNLSLVLGNANITDAVTAALVGKASGASINATGATNGEVATLAASVGNIAANGITGNLPLTSATAGADISALMAKYGGTTTAVNAQGMNLAQLQALAAASGKIGVNGIIDLFVRSSESTLTDADFSTLLSKSAAAFASFDAVNASTARLQLVADNISRFFDTGIIGTLNLNSQFSAAQLSALTSAKVQVAANVQVDAAGMTTAQLVALAANASKVDTLSNVQALALGDAAMTATYANYLLSAGTGATVVATGASEANVQRLFNQLSKVADQGISGVLPLTAAQFNATSASALDPKLAASASVAVTGSASDETFDIRNYTHSVTIAAGDGRDTLIVSGTSLLGAGVSSTAFTGMDVLQLKGTATAYMSKVAGVTELSIDPATGPIEVREITAAQAQNLKILNGPGASIALYLDGAATSTTDIVKATVSTTNPGGGGQPIDLTGITLPDVEALEITNNGSVARGVLTLTTANARALTSIKFVNNGDSFITVDAAHTGSGLVIDGRGSARTVIDASAYAPASGVTIYGGNSNTSNSSKLNGSAGADVIVGGANDDIIAGDGPYRDYAGLGEVQTFAFSGDTGQYGGFYTLGGYLLTRPGGVTTASLATLINNGIVQVLQGNPDVANAVFSATQVVVTFKVKAGDVAPLVNSFVNYNSNGQVDPTITPTLTAGPSVQTRAYDPAVSFAAPAAFASADTLTGGAGKNTFAFAQNSSTVTAYDTITDLKLGPEYGAYVDTLIFVNPNGTSAASILSGQAQTDVTAAGSLAAAVNLALNTANSDGYSLQFTYGGDTWLLHNGDGNATFNNGTDYLLKITGVTGTLDQLDVLLG